MKKLKVKVGYGLWEREGFIEGALTTSTTGDAILVYFPHDKSLKVVSLNDVIPIGYEEV